MQRNGKNTSKIGRKKTFEIRKNDRYFHVGDRIVLKEWDNIKYSGREIHATIKYMHDDAFIGLEFMQMDFTKKYTPYEDDSMKLYIDKAVQEGYDTEIFMDVKLHHYPLRDYCSMWNELQNTVRQYGKIGKRNEKAIEHGKIAKHSMHLIRLYMMCLDILEKERIITYREDEHDLLMDIRNGKYLNSNDQPIPEFFEMVNDYEKRLDYAKKNTNLSDNPDYKAINEFVASVNERVVKGEI